MAAIMGETKIFEKWDGHSAELPCGSTITSKSLYLARFSRYMHFCVWKFLQKIRKIQNGRHFGRDKFFFVFVHLSWNLVPKTLWLGIILNQWLPFWARQIFFENWDDYSVEISCASKISSKSLYLARLSRYKHFCVLQFLRKIRKFKMAAILGDTNFFVFVHLYLEPCPQNIITNIN